MAFVGTFCGKFFGSKLTSNPQFILVIMGLTHIPQKNFDSQTINLIYIVSKLCQISITSHFVVYSDRE